MAVYKFKIKGNGNIGGVIYTEGMNVEVVVNGLGSTGTPFNSVVEKLFIQEFAEKYKIEPRYFAAIKMLFNQRNLDFVKL